VRTFLRAKGVKKKVDASAAVRYRRKKQVGKDLQTDIFNSEHGGRWAAGRGQRWD